jgi:aminoglycoside/choline kinase family phosphotransferase
VLLDLQGAFLAPPEYDLVCLLRDSYVELPDVEVAQQLARVRPALPDAPDADAFGVRFDLLTLTRKGKDLALYLQSARTRGLTNMLAFVPAAVRAVRSAAARRAGDDVRLARLEELIATLPEQPCVQEPPHPPESP